MKKNALSYTNVYVCGGGNLQNGSVYVYDKTSVNPKNIIVIIILRGSATFNFFLLINSNFLIGST